MAWARICYWMKNNFPYRFYIADSDEAYRQCQGKKFDSIIVPYGFNFIIRDTPSLIRANLPCRLYWLTNEYDLPFDGGKRSFGSVYKEIGFDVLANMPRSSYKMKLTNLIDWHFINFNVSAYRTNVNTKQVKKYDSIYWGRPREDRIELFKKYLQKKVFYLSCNNQAQRNNHKLFLEMGLDTNFCDPVDWANPNNLLTFFKYTIYLEDKHTHNNFNSLSDRFYEALSHKLIMFWDNKCRHTVASSGYPIHPFCFVDSLAEYQQKIEYLNSRRHEDNFAEYMSPLKTHFDNEQLMAIQQVDQLFR